MCNQKTWIPESGFFISIRWSEQHAYPCLLQFPTNKRGLGFFIIKKLSLEPIFKPMWRCQCISIIWQRNRISWLMLTRCECYLCPALEKIKYISDNSSRSNASSPALCPLNHMSVLTSAVISYLYQIRQLIPSSLHSSYQQYTNKLHISQGKSEKPKEIFWLSVELFSSHWTNI